jgi:hypothetical protein
VIAQDDLRLFRSDGSFVAEFSGFKQFSGWQPDSSAMIFVTRLESSSLEVLNYFQLGDQSLQTFSRSMFDDYNFVWGRGPALEGNLEGMRCYQDRKSFLRIIIHRGKKNVLHTFFFPLWIPS